jgi:DNA-binding transcriptional LysR family regulator
VAQANAENRAMTASQIELEAVVAVARRGGFRAAARELRMSSSALSHAVAALEARLGVRLFNRTTRSVALSAAGEQFVAEVAPALAAIRTAIERVDEHRAEPSGVLRLNMAPGAARMILAPLVFEYLAAIRRSASTWSPRAPWWTSWDRASTPVSGWPNSCLRT